jgi:IS30 family transposase
MSPSRPATRHWTSDEERKLDALLDADKGVAEIAAVLNRTCQAIYARLQKRAKRRPEQSPHSARRRWTSPEDRMLCELLASGEKRRLIAQKMNRTMAAIEGRMYVLRNLAKAKGK